ncbi:MAG: methyltransferase FkbM family [Candidatus Solibacter sp.]|jgi:FkbM family methyltransferase|nr:methyltransferase FkbM family [Candidatus Solibacter sp.]
MNPNATDHIAPCPWHIALLAGMTRRMPRGRYVFMHNVRPTLPPFWLGLHSGGLFVCDLQDIICREVCFTGKYEPQETAIVDQVLKSGMTFVDVGANWGYFSLLAACKVGTRGRVISLEPDPRMFATLAANIERNLMAQITAVPVAAADGRGSITLAGYDDHHWNRGISRIAAEGSPTGGVSFQVDSSRVDDLLDEQGVDRVDLLKMDIEGAEDLALSGMAEGLRRQRYRRVLLEVHPADLALRGRTPDEVSGLLSGAGYRAFRVDDSNAATRRACYARRPDAREFLSPVAEVTVRDRCHFLWVARGEREL